MRFQRPVFSSFLRIFLFLGVAGLCLMTAVGYFSLSTLVKTQAQSRYEKQTKEITNAIAERMNSHADILYRARAFVLVNRNPTQAEWETFFANQDLFHQGYGVDAVAFSRYESGKSQAATERELSRDFKTTLKITPTGERSEYLPVIDVATANPSGTKVNGIDLLSEEVRRQAITEARNTGQPVLTQPIDLIPSSKQAVVMFLPVYIENNQLYGFISAVYFTDSFMHGVLDTENTTGLSAQIVDTEKNQEIYKSPTSVMGASFTRNDQLSIAGRRWVVNYSAPSRIFGDGHLLPNIVVAIGLIFIVGAFIAARTILNFANPVRTRG